MRNLGWLGAAVVLLGSVGCAHQAASGGPTTSSASTAGAPSEPEANVTLQRYQSPAGYSVMMPPAVQTRERTEQTLGGPVVTKLAEAHSPQGTLHFSASVTALPQMAVNTMSEEGLLQTAQKSALKELDAKLNTQRELKSAGLSAREFTARSGRGDNVIGRVLLDGGNLYSLLLIYPSTVEPAPPEASKFLDSFQR